MFIIASLAVGLLGFLITLIKPEHYIYKYIIIISVVVNIICVLLTVFCDPGIKKEIYFHYSKIRLSRDKIVIEENDLESGGA